jgi:hypothetical protein
MTGPTWAFTKANTKLKNTVRRSKADIAEEKEGIKGRNGEKRGNQKKKKQKGLLFLFSAI